MTVLQVVLEAIEKMARRSQLALFGFTLCLLVAGLGLAGAVLAYLIGYWAVFGGSMLIAFFGFAAATAVVVAHQYQRSVHARVTEAASRKRNQVSARYN